MRSRVVVSSLIVHLLCVAAATAQSPEPRDQPKLPPVETTPTAQPAPVFAPAQPAAAQPPATAPAQPVSTPPTPTTSAPAAAVSPPPTPATPPAGATGAAPGPIPGVVPAAAETPATSPPPLAPFGAGVSKPGSADLTAGDPGYQARLRGLEEKVNELKEKVFSSKARLVLLQEAVLHGSVTGAYALLMHKNTMGGAYKLEYASYHLDGQPIYQPTDTTELEKKAEFPIFNGAIVPGSHTVSVYLVYRGASNVFAYWQGYQFKIKSSFTFHFEEGKITNIKVVGYEKGGVTVDMKDRPAVRFDVDVQKVTKSSAQGLGPAAAPAGTSEAK